MSEEGQTKTDNGRLAREMVERCSHRNQLRRGETEHTEISRDGAGMGKYQNKGKATQSLSQAGPRAQIWGGSAKRQNFHCPPQTGAEGKSTKAPKSLELHQRPLSQQGLLHGNSRSVYTQGALCSRYRTPDRCTFSASHL